MPTALTSLSSGAGITLACDAMGGDHGVHAVVPGAALALKQKPDLRFIMAGHAPTILAVLNRFPELKARTTLIETDETVAAHEKPSAALRRKNTSMRLAIDAVVGEAQAVVSSGNTGALMAIAKLVLRPLPGVHRPAIAAVMPNMKKTRTVMLDMGANLVCDAENFVQFAALGALYMRSAYNVAEPRIGLMNVGSEDTKGHEVQQNASRMLQAAKLPGKYVGFVEGNDITSGAVDVVVCDGFTGNVALKTAEGVGKMFGNALKEELKSSVLTKIGALFCMGALQHLKRRFDPRLYNGGVFLGLSGLCLKSHGSADALAFSNALLVAATMAERKFTDAVATQMKQLAEQAVYIELQEGAV